MNILSLLQILGLVATSVEAATSSPGLVHLPFPLPGGLADVRRPLGLQLWQTLTPEHTASPAPAYPSPADALGFLRALVLSAYPSWVPGGL